MQKITTTKYSYFFSDEILIKPSSSAEVIPSDLTEVQLEDIIEGYLTGRLLVDNISAFYEELESRKNKGDCPIQEDKNLIYKRIEW